MADAADEIRRAMTALGDTMADVVEEKERLKERVGKLESALKPFADFIEGTSDFWDDERRIGSLNYDFGKLTVGMFRRAAKALGVKS